MSDGAAVNRRMRLDVHLHLAGEDRAYLAGLLLGVESRRGSVAQFPANDHGVVAPARSRGGGTFIKAFCVAAVVAVVAGASYRAGGVGLRQPPEIIPPPGGPSGPNTASGPAAFGLKE